MSERNQSARLADAITLAGRAWEALVAGNSLEKSLELATRGVDARLRAATQDLLYTATRQRSRTEVLLAKLAQRPPAPPVVAVLAVALAQLHSRASADYVVVDQAVMAAKEEPILASAAGFINAVLRRYTRERETLDAELDARQTVRWNAPDWWIARVRRTGKPCWMCSRRARPWSCASTVVAPASNKCLRSSPVQASRRAKSGPGRFS